MSDHFDNHRNNEHYHYHSYGHHGHDRYLMYLEYAKRIFKNKTFLMIALAIFLIILIVGIWLISLVLPLLGQLLSLVEKNGIRSAFEAISPYLLKLWEGSGK